MTTSLPAAHKEQNKQDNSCRKCCELQALFVVKTFRSHKRRRASYQTGKCTDARAEEMHGDDHHYSINKVSFESSISLCIAMFSISLIPLAEGWV